MTLVRQCCHLAEVNCPSGPRILPSRGGGFSKHDGKIRRVDGFVSSLDTRSRIAGLSEKLGVCPSSGLEVFRM